MDGMLIKSPVQIKSDPTKIIQEIPEEEKNENFGDYGSESSSEKEEESVKDAASDNGQASAEIA